MDLDNLRAHMDSRFDRLEDKLDDHNGRLSRAEEALTWVRGHVKIVTTLGLAAFSSLAAGLAKLWFGF